MKRMTLCFMAVLALSLMVIGNNTVQAQETMVLGKLNFVNLKEGEKPIMESLTVAGNRCVSEAFNAKPYATEGIRSIFELDEWVEFYPNTHAETGIKVMVFQHKNDQGFYLKNTLNDETDGYCQTCELNKDPDLKRSVDDFRQRNYNFQQSEDIDLNEYDQFRSELVGFRASDQRVDTFLDAELALCRMIQDISYRITEAIDFE